MHQSRTVSTNGQATSQTTGFSTSAAGVRRCDTIVKSESDLREYRGLELSNGLRVLLVSDPQTDKSAAALNVNVGHLMDPWELPGLAHFCEHMLFLGTKKYPSENDYNKFLAANAGSSNAYTAADHTNYHFSVKPEALEGALDRFVQFFLEPLFTQEATEREVCAVDSEHSNNLRNDSWRLLQIERSLSAPGHDYGKFGTGSKKTLLEDARLKGLEPRDALLEFHNKWYSSNIMALVVVGKESLDQLEELIERLGFSKIVNKNVERKTWTEHPRGDAQLKRRVDVVPVKELRSLHLIFPMPDYTDRYRVQPTSYVSHIIGEESAGSLLSLLKRRGWASALNAGMSPSAKGFGDFVIKVELTTEGEHHIDDIVQLFFAMIGLLTRSPINQRVMDEIRQIDSVNFRFLDKQKPLSYATHLASKLWDYDIQDVLRHSYLHDAPEDGEIPGVLRRLVPGKCHVKVVSKSVAEWRKDQLVEEPIYGTQHYIEPLAEKSLRAWEEAMLKDVDGLTLPAENPYIPSKFDLKPRDAKETGIPRLIRDDDDVKVWFKQDDEYKLPKMVSRISLIAPEIAKDVRSQMLAILLHTCFEDSSSEFFYPPELAGLSGSVIVAKNKIMFKTSGYDEKQALFTKELVRRFVDYRPDEQRLAINKERLERSLRSFPLNQPYMMASHFSSLLLDEFTWDHDEMLAVLNDITLDEIKAFAPKMFDRYRVEALVHGNCTEEEALKLVEDARAELPKGKDVTLEEDHVSREKELPHGNSLVLRFRQETHANSCVLQLMQIGEQSRRRNVLLELFNQIVKEPAFNVLRTNEQLGYIVFSHIGRTAATQTYKILVQGLHNPEHVEDRINHFLASVKQTLVEMSDDEFAEHREALAVQRLEQPKRLSARSSEYWDEIRTRAYQFHRVAEEVAELRGLTKQDVIDFFDTFIAASSPQRRHAVSIVHAKGDQEDKEATRQKRDAAEESAKNRTEVSQINQTREALPWYRSTVAPDAKL